MYKVITYCLVLCCVFIHGCKKKAEGVNWAVSLSHEDKNPYGCYLAYQSMEHFFPGIKVEALSTGFRYNNIDGKMKYDKGRALLVLTGLSFYLSDDELYALLDFVKAGNEVVLLSAAIDDKLEEHLKCYKASYVNDEETPLSKYNSGKPNINIISLVPDTATKYGFQGRSLAGSFKPGSSDTESDLVALTEETIEQPDGEKLTRPSAPGDTIDIDDVTTTEEAEQTENTYSEYENEDEYDNNRPFGAAEVLGYVKGQPQMVRYSIGTGHITLHAAPLVMSNYFLLQEKNINYLQGFWNMMPSDITHVYWNSFYRHHAEHSDLGILWRNKATKMALILAIIVLLLYVLLEIKRRQNPIAIITPLENTSATFVETIGRLYYNKGNHSNLAEKMVQHFLEFVRTHYYLNTNQLDDEFARSLAAKSGLPMEVTMNMVEMIHEVKMGTYTIDEPYLYHLNTTIQRFYKK